MKQTFTFLIALLMLGTAVAQNKKVAVWETKCSDNSITKFQSVMVRGGMEAAVANAPGYTGFDRASFDAIIKEHNFQRSGAVNDSDIKRLGEMAGVQYIIVPEAMADGNDFYIIVKMLDVESGEFGAAYEELCTTSATDIKNACAKLGSQLFGIPYTGGGNTSGGYSGGSGGSSGGDGSVIGQILVKVLKNVSATLDGGGSHIGDTDKPGIVFQYDADGNLYCGGYGYDASTTSIGMYVAAEGYELANCPGSWVYVGKYKNGVKEGDGLVYDRDGTLIYSGKFSNDKPTEKYPDAYARTVIAFNAYDMGNGDYYIGETIEGVLDGCGLYVWSDGDAWFGFWKEGVQNGPGIMMNYDGSYQTGTWKDGKMASNTINYGSSSGGSTQSKYKLSDHPWSNLLKKATTNAPAKFNNGNRIGNKNGAGVYSWFSGALYAGEFREGNFEGAGFKIQEAGYEFVGCDGGVVITGTWKDDKPDFGRVYNKEGKLIYRGKFKNGKPSETYPSSDYTLSSYRNCTFGVDISESTGAIYVGEYTDGIRSGMGLYLWPNGDCWVGNFKNGTFNGYGCYMYYSGNWQHGKWEDGKLIQKSSSSF